MIPIRSHGRLLRADSDDLLVRDADLSKISQPCHGSRRIRQTSRLLTISPMRCTASIPATCAPPYKCFVQYYPTKEKPMRQALEYAVNPIADLQEL